MRDRLLLVLIVAAAMVISTVAVKADVPTLIGYQGVITDSEGEPITGVHNVTFTIYDAPTVGNDVWSETQTVTFDDEGRFDVLLGEIGDITDDVFDDPVRWLGVQMQGDDEMIPRTRIVSTAYAHRISTIDGAGGGTISGDVAIQSDLNVDGDIRVTGKATIGPGHTNTGVYAFVAGEDNTASADYATVGGGLQNTASFTYATVAGGVNNAATGEWSTVAGGVEDTASGSRSMVGGGVGNTASGPYSIVGGGYHNSATSAASVVAGGQADTASGNHSVVGGGQNNTASGIESVVGGGIGNTASGLRSVVGGGYANEASYETNVIGGGWRNYTAMYHSTVGGGMQDTASGAYSTVSGGYINLASQWGSTVSGGEDNTASGLWSTVPGGVNNTASGLYSLAAGYRANAVTIGSFVWADGIGSPYTSTADNQFLIRASGGVGIGTNNPTSSLHVEGEVKSVVDGVNFYMVPQGAIIMWSGALADIPDGWQLCNGANGTPNLSNRFIYGTTGAPGGTGGSETIPNHTHTVTHDHPIETTSNNSHYRNVFEVGGYNVARHTHTHTLDLPSMTVTSSSAGSYSNLPPYYKLAFIMKL